MEIAEQVKRALSVRENHAEVIEGPAGPKKLKYQDLSLNNQSKHI